MRIPRPIVDQIYAALDILEVVQDYLPLKKRGQNWWGLSPFKAERTPSFAVNPAKGIFKDFSSGRGGNAVTFLMEVEAFTYTEALLHLARKYNIEVPELAAEDKGAEDKRTTLFGLNKFAAEWYQRQLATDEGRAVGLSYFTERGISQPAREAFGLGYSPEQWDAFTQTALRLNFSIDILIESGLSLRSEDGTRTYDRFRGRVIFPIYDAAGRVAGFGGRLLKSDAKAAKYVNSPESAVYAKSSLLYGLYQARQSLREQGRCILTEGYTDVISLHQAGITNAVASSGTSLTEGQIALIARYAREVLILYDGDSAGISAAERAMDMLLEAGLAVKAVILPDQHDPDSYVRAFGAEAFGKYTSEHAQDVVSFRLGAMGLSNPEQAQAAGPDAIGRALRLLGQTLARIPDEITRSLYAAHVSRQLGVSEQLALSAVNQASLELARDRQREEQRAQQRAEFAPEAPPHPDGPVIAPGPPSASVDGGLLDTYHQERELLRLLINYGDQPLKLDGAEVTVLAHVADTMGDAAFDHPVHELVRSWLTERHVASEPFTIQPLMAELGANVNHLVSDLINLRIDISENWQKLEVSTPPMDADLLASTTEALDHWQWRRVQRLLAENAQLIRNAADHEQITIAVQRHSLLETFRRDLSSRLGIVTDDASPS